MIIAALAALLGACMLAGGARADDGASAAPAVNRKAAARALFEEGLKLLEAEHWAAAREKFERARQFHASPRIAYNLTTALVQMGKLVYATELLRELTTAPAVERGVQTAAETRLRDVRARLGTLTISVDGDRRSVSVELNGRPFDEALLDVPTPVDPGEHTIAARRAGATLVSRTVAVQEGQRETVHLAVPARPMHVTPPAPGAPASEALSLTTSAGDSAPRPEGTGAWLWLGAGAAVLAGAAATWFLLSSDDPARVDGTVGTATVKAP